MSLLRKKLLLGGFIAFLAWTGFWWFDRGYPLGLPVAILLWAVWSLGVLFFPVGRMDQRAVISFVLRVLWAPLVLCLGLAYASSQGDYGFGTFGKPVLLCSAGFVTVGLALRFLVLRRHVPIWTAAAIAVACWVAYSGTYRIQQSCRQEGPVRLKIVRGVDMAAADFSDDLPTVAISAVPYAGPIVAGYFLTEKAQQETSRLALEGRRPYSRYSERAPAEAIGLMVAFVASLLLWRPPSAKTGPVKPPALPKRTDLIPVPIVRGHQTLDLDANATTRPDPAVVQAMLPWFTESHGNPSSEHRLGREARRAVENARADVAALIRAEPEEILFTSGGTESINSVHLFAQREWPERPVLITGATEHPAGIESAVRWRQQGGEVRTLPVAANGVIDLGALRDSLAPGRTALVSIMWANNEVGTIAPMREIVEIAHGAGALVHADAVQMVGKCPVDVRAVPVDYLSLSGHKIHGPKGVGALYVSRRARFRPLLVGGGQENGRRSGTENVPGIVGLGAAARLARQHLTSDAEKIAALRDLLERLILQDLPDTFMHAAGALRLPNTASLHFPGVDAAGLLILLDEKGIACSGGSACHAGQLHPSHVLEAMGFDAAHAGSTLRFSLSRFTTEAEIRTAAAEVIRAVARLRKMFDPSSPVTLA